MAGLHDSPLYIAILTAYSMGFVSCLTPCVYPLIPITLSLFGARNEHNRVKAFLLSFSYVSGIAVMYTILGIVTAKLGIVFGTILGNPFVVIPLCGALLLLSLHTVGILSIPLGTLQTKATAIGGAGYIGALMMGAVSGGVAAPCVGPVLAILLVEVAQSHNMTRAVSMLLSYSFGLGTPFLVLGTFSALLTSLPRSGNWLHYVKFLIASCLLGEIFFLLNSLTINGFLPSDPLMVWVAILALSLPIGILTIQQSRHTLQIPSAALLALAAIQIIAPAHLRNGTEIIEWVDNQEAAFQSAKEQRRPIMIDLSARWCVACKELEHTFSESHVAQTIRDNLVAMRIDFTTETPATREISSRYGVVGLPCILFVKPDGQEIKDSRITGKVSPKEFLEHVNHIGDHL